MGSQFELRRGDHVCIIGNTLADRMQHHGWLETMLQSRFPEHELVFRNLGFAGDEVKQRPRSSNFGSPDQWLTKTQADVVFGFFGYNEALRGAAAVDGFRKDLAETIDAMRAQQYNGESPPRLVMFSPIAHENLNSPHLPTGSENNAKFAEVLTCDAHSHFASVPVKAPPEGEMPDELVLMFSNCVKSDDIEWEAVFERVGAAMAYQEEQGYKKGDWMLWPVFGGEGDDTEGRLDDEQQDQEQQGIGAEHLEVHQQVGTEVDDDGH